MRLAARVLSIALLALVATASAGSRPVAAPAVSGWLTYGNDVSRRGDAGTSLDAARLRPAWFADVDGMVTTQPLVAHNVPSAGQSTIYVGVSSGRFEALAPNGYVRWSIDLGIIPQSCPQLPTWGVTGTPVIDPATRAVYVADAFGWLHALDLATGRERPGWPVKLYADSRGELVWGALADVDGSIYVGTGSYCNEPMEGKLVRVDIATHTVTSWISVPSSLGGGGSIWGWGGVAYSTRDDALYVATGPAFTGGMNTGNPSDDSAGYGEHLVELNRDLDVLGADHPPDIPNGEDSDFVGSPVIADPAGCGEVVGAINKDGAFYLYHGNEVSAGAFAEVQVQATDFSHPMLTNPAYDPALRSFYFVTFTQLVRVTIDDGCVPHVTWRVRFGKSTLNSSPTIAGGLVWLALSGQPATLLAYDAQTGARTLRKLMGGMSFDAPTIVDGRLFDDARHGFSAGARPSLPMHTVGTGPGLTSWSDSRHGWVSRESGVFSTDDGGRHWRRIFAGPAERVVRTSVTAGVISVGVRPTACNCTTRRLWTTNDGRTWHTTRELGPSYAGKGSILVWWSGSTLRQIVPWPATSGTFRSRLLARLNGQIASAAAIPGGAAALLTDAGKGWDNAPRLALVRGGTVRMLTLSHVSGDVLAVELHAAWPRLVVTGIVADGPPVTVTWRTSNGGAQWTTAERRG